MKFLAETVSEIDRHTDCVGKTKHEVLTLSVKFISSGDTRRFSTFEVLQIVLEKLEEIEPKSLNKD